MRAKFCFNKAKFLKIFVRYLGTGKKHLQLLKNFVQCTKELFIPSSNMR